MPKKVSFFMWTAALGNILTTDNLWKCRVVALDWCCMCKKDGESIDHLLLLCHVARVVEYGIFFIWGSLGYSIPCCGSSSKLVV